MNDERPGFEARLRELRERAAGAPLSEAGVRPSGSPLPATAGPEEPGYYGLPLLKPPVWTWEVPAYFVVGGAAGAAAAIGAIARATGADPALVRDARWIAAAGAVASPPLLVSDLGRPERFLNMLRVFKLQSPMSVGAWTLVAFSNAAAATAFAQVLRRETRERVLVRIVADASEILSAATGLVLATYTGVLIGATAVPVWSRHVTMLPVHFGASGLGAAASMLELLGHREPALHRLAMGVAAVETLIALRVESSAGKADEVREPLRQGRAGAMTRLGGVLSGPLPLALRLFAGRSPTARQVAAVATVAGSILTRFGWLAAGPASTRQHSEAPADLTQSASAPVPRR